MPQPHPLVVFTDLDGTLLDHDSYSWAPAEPALARLADLGAVVVLASSKTASEIAVLQDAMGLAHWPAIVENGAGVLGDGAPSRHGELRGALGRVPGDLRRHFTGFGDMTPAEVAACTGLAPQDAARARARMFSEPGLWSGSDADRARFLAALAREGVTARQGGRFLTLSFGRTKADRMAEIVARYRPAHTIALGDAPNDIEMLEAADQGIIVANPHAPPMPALPGEATGRIRRTRQAGPSGWNTAILDALDRLGLWAQQRER